MWTRSRLKLHTGDAVPIGLMPCSAEDGNVRPSSNTCKSVSTKTSILTSNVHPITLQMKIYLYTS